MTPKDKQLFLGLALGLIVGAIAAVFLVTSRGNYPTAQVEVQQGEAISYLDFNINIMPFIQSLTPESGPVGTFVEIRGQNFHRTGNIIQFGPGFIKQLFPSNGRTITFQVPEAVVACRRQQRRFTCDTLIPVVPGEYEVRVSNKKGLSNPVEFLVNDNQDDELPISIPKSDTSL